jgi:hypothetical protein
MINGKEKTTHTMESDVQKKLRPMRKQWSGVIREASIRRKYLKRYGATKKCSGKDEN